MKLLMKEIEYLKVRFDEGKLSLVDIILHLTNSGASFTPVIGSEKFDLPQFNEFIQFGEANKRGFYAPSPDGNLYFNDLYARVGVIYKNEKLPVIIWLPEIKK